MIFQVVILDNGLVELSFSNPGGDVIGIKYNGITNLLEIHNKKSNRGYWDIEWGDDITSNIADHYDRLEGTKFEIINEDENQIEISFTKRWNDSSHSFPINVDKRYIMLRDYPGFYTYAILEHPKEAPAAQISVVRDVFKLQQNKFQYMAISDDIQRTMPSASDRTSGEKLAYPEAVLLTKPSKLEFKGEVDDKYQYSIDHKDIKVHGWISSNPAVGFWMITPSHEFLTTGPMKQELTSHVGPTSLCVFMSCHYVGKDLIMKFDKGETWKKVFGPIPIYLNSVSNDEDNRNSLWENAKKQAQDEVAKWPYNFIHSKDFPTSDQRGTLNGQLLIRDRYINEGLFEASSAYVGLAAPGEAGSWQRESKGYQFWVKADESGNFSIKNVRPGNYSLYAFVPGVIGDYVHEKIVSIEPGARIELDSLVYEPPRNGPTLWEIGIPDRTAAEYYVPDALPTLANRFYLNKPNHKFRQYGLWDRYTDLYPNNDLVYTVGVSDFRHDWFFAHVNRNTGNGTYQETTWQVKFNLQNVMWDENYTLRLAIASAQATNLQVRFNYPPSYPPMFSTHRIGRDNSIARHGIHGLYWLYSVNIPGFWLLEGNNTLYLTQARSQGPFGGLMYDYIRFEAPPVTFIA
ncbi:hypothetical protein L484_009236 [Morus notabilis]|uniref:rhamnogalacturonan endolyase n=1 Tax=Morus notabilis TaxID=981085 RepID=W9SJK7_9ROSA|nr:hypothetical protein L484_009236 [Morus notabilis]